MKCADVNDRLIDFLYDELSPADRDAFEAHLRECAACSGERLSLQRALGQTRGALAGPLAQEPPRRVHDAVLAVARRAGTQPRGPAARHETGWLARFWRTPWFLPAFGAVSVATVVFLVRVLKDPEVLPGQRGHSIEERAVAPAAPALAATPAATARSERQHEESVAAPGEPRIAEKSRTGQPAPKARKLARGAAGGSDRGYAAPGKGIGRGYAEPPPPAAPPKRRQLDDRSGTAVEHEGARAPQPAAPALPQKAASQAKSEPAEALEAAPPLPQPRSAEAKAARPRGYASPPPVPAVAPSARPAPSRARPSTPSPTPSHAPAPAAAPPTAESPALEDVASKKEKSERTADRVASSFEESVRRADRLFAAGSWTAAADAYRALLRQLPNAKDAPRWRERINQAALAEEAARKANEAKAAP